MGRKVGLKWNAQRKNTASWKHGGKFISGLNQQNYLKNKLNLSNEIKIIKATTFERFT